MVGMTDRCPVIALVRDLIFASRITATAAAVGVPVTLVRDPNTMDGVPAAKLLIVDLNLEGAIEAARQWRTVTGGVVTGFVSHVDTATITAARAAGIDRVLARSRFVEVLPQVLSGEVTGIT
jgi:hypothetical protein